MTGDLEGQRRFSREIPGLWEVEAGDDGVGFDLGGNWFELLAVSERPQYGNMPSGSFAPEPSISEMGTTPRLMS